MQQAGSRRDRLVEIYGQAADIPIGKVPPVGMLLSQMIETILDKEEGPRE